jgi:aminopeptidase-like protein
MLSRFYLIIELAILNISDLIKSIDPVKTGQELHSLMGELYPICRSITGTGLRQTLGILKHNIPLQIQEVPSGTKVFDWVVPKEWNINDAYIKNSAGEKVVDFQKSNLHILNYSMPINKTVSIQELREHLFTLPDHPDWVPYKTSYYKENWGFCLSHNQFLKLTDANYDVFIDATLEDGSLSYGELYLEGREKTEILISCHACHPSIANDNLSGIAVASLLAKHLSTISHRHSYRFLFIPGTIGAIAWLALNEEKATNIKHGLVLSGVGDRGNITYKKSRQGNAQIDHAADHVLKHSTDKYDIIDFYPYGYDERQYCSPGFNLPIGCFSRTPYGKYPEYHTSADNMDFVVPECLNDSLIKIISIFEVLEENFTYLNLYPKCEPQLGRRGLYAAIGSDEMAMLWVLNLSDGNNTLLDIAERAGLKFEEVLRATQILCKNNLLKKAIG